VEPLVTRDATEADAAGIQAIYAPIVMDTVISFETEPPSVDEMAGRIRTVTASHPWLVAVDPSAQDMITGYAYATRHRERAAYAWSVDVSVYVAASYRSRGIGKKLYHALFERLAALGYVNAFAGVALPNEASVALHASVGFDPVGIYRHVGFKHGAWHDAAWFQRLLRPLPLAPPDPRTNGGRSPFAEDVNGST
jgi:L-amino acid N-acyltransferase YncA